jgi:outer membrane protein assembly factor BamB
VYDLEAEGLKMLWRAELGHIGGTRLAELYPTGRLLVAETPAGEMHVLDALSGRWQTSRMLRHGLEFSPTPAGNKLYVVSHNKVYGFDLETGKMGEGYHPSFAVMTPPVVFQDSLILAGGNGHLARVTVVGSEELWLTSIDGPIWEQPVLDGGTLFAASSELIRLEADAGRELWRWRPASPARLTTGVAVHGGNVYAGDNRGYLHALGVEHGDQRWQMPFGASPVGTLEVVDGKLLVSTNKPAVTCLDVEGEREALWRYEGAVEMLAVGRGKVYLLTDDHSIAAVSLQEGKELWREPLPEESLAVGDPHRAAFYVGNPEGTIAAFEELD